MNRPLLDEVSLLDALEIETVGAITYELSGRFTDVNDTFLEMSGYSREDLEAGDLTWQRLTPAEWHHVSERARSQLEASGRTTPYEKQYFRKDGSRFWVLAASKLLPSGSAFGLVVDITDRKAAEARAAALARLSDRLSNLEGPDEIAFVAAQVLGEAVNATHVGYADMDEADMIRTQDDWIAPGIVPVIQSRRFHTPESVSGRLRQGEVVVIADVNAEERSAHVGAVLENRNGRTIVLAPILEQGRLAAIFFVKDRQPRDWSAEEVALIQEVAHRTRTAVERARTTRALRETQEVLRRANEDLELRVAERTAERDRIWDISRDLMCVATMDGTFLNVNPAWERVLGWSPDQLLGRKSGEIRHPDDAASATVQLARNATGVPSHGFEARYRHREGGWRWISWSIQPEGDRLYGVGRDITAEKETRAALEAAEAARREADDLYRAYFQNTFEGLFVVAVRPDGEFSIEELNPAHNAAMGLPMEEIRGKVLAEQIGPEAAAAASVNYRRAVDLEAPLRYRESGPARGELRHYETVLVPVRDDRGRIARLVGSARDITAQVQLEAAEAGRRKADALYRGYFLNSAEGLFSIAVLPDGDFSVEEVNPAYEAVVGLDAQGKLGQPIEEQFGPEIAALVRSNYQRAVATGQVQRYRESAVLAGQLIQVETVLVPIRDESGQITRIVGSSRDMSVEAQLEASEAARRDADALYRAYFQNSTEALCIADVGADGAFSISDVNPAYEAASGLRASGKLGLPLDQQFPPALASSIAAKYRDVLTKGEVQQYQTSLEYEGKVSHAILVDVPLRDKAGVISRIVTSSRSVTAQVEAEEKLRQSQKLEAMGQLTGGVAHDFNNLLTPIMKTLDRMQWKRLGDDIDRHLVDGAIQSAERARTLVQRLLAFARRQPLEARAVEMGELVRGMADLVASTTGPQIRIHVETAPDLRPALADANQVEMAVLNLALNARDAMPEGGDLRISAVNETVEPGHRSGAAPGSYVRLSISDTGIGIGMDEVTLARAVEPFFSTKGVGQGTGLGLSMVHGLAAQLGGALTLASELGVGTQADLWLPVAGGSAEPAPPPAERGPATKAGLALLVDDEELVRGAAAYTLGDLGYEVTEAASAEEAIQLLDGGLLPDLVVTDHLMPGMSGADLARLLQARRPGLPVLLISGYALTSGDADLPRLAKPFRGSELAAAIARLLGQTAA